MSELQFPKDPIVGQEYDFPPYKYYWDGTKWKTKGIGYNPVNDLRNELEPRISTSESKISDNESKVFEALRRSYAEAGLNLVDGSFEEGGTLTSSNDVLLHKVTDIAYSWGGTLPITVAPNSTPTPLGAGGWIDRSNATLRSYVTAHEAKSGAHAISGVAGLQGALDWKYSPNNKPTAADVGALASNGTAVAATRLATARTLTIGNTGKAFDGTGNVSWSAAEIGGLVADVCVPTSTNVPGVGSIAVVNRATAAYNGSPTLNYGATVAGSALKVGGIAYGEFATQACTGTWKVLSYFSAVGGLSSPNSYTQAGLAIRIA